jgi:hypothetical protein
LTEQEWNQSHPEQCNAYIKAWENKEARERARLASLQHIVAVSGGIKIKGRAPRFEDFFQAPKKVRSPEAEAQIALFQLNALKRKEEKKHGKK